MTMMRPNCAVMYNSINMHIRDQSEWHITTRMTAPDYAVMFYLINTHTLTRHNYHLSTLGKTKTSRIN